MARRPARCPPRPADARRARGRPPVQVRECAAHRGREGQDRRDERPADGPRRPLPARDDDPRARDGPEAGRVRDEDLRSGRRRDHRGQRRRRPRQLHVTVRLRTLGR